MNEERDGEYEDVPDHLLQDEPEQETTTQFGRRSVPRTRPGRGQKPLVKYGIPAIIIAVVVIGIIAAVGMMDRAPEDGSTAATNGDGSTAATNREGTNGTSLDQTDRDAITDTFAAMRSEIQAIGERLDQMDQNSGTDKATPAGAEQPGDSPDGPETGSNGGTDNGNREDDATASTGGDGNREEQQPKPAATPVPAATGVPTAPEPAASPPPTEAPASPGICGRSPAMQKVILEKLNTSSCREVTTDELFRITELPTVQWNSIPKPGDFKGLVNLTEFNYEDPRKTNSQTPLPAQTFRGLQGITEMNLTVRGLESRAMTGLDSLLRLNIVMPAHGTLSPGAFQGMPELEHLTIRTPAPERDFDQREFLPVMDRLPRIRTLTLETSGWIIPMKAGILRNLTNLQSMTVTGDIPANEPIKVYWLPASLFTTNLELHTIEVTVNGPETVVKAPPEILEHLEKLKYLSLRYTGETDDDGHMLPPPLLYLSRNTPLAADLANGRSEKDGYEVYLSSAN